MQNANLNANLCSFEAQKERKITLCTFFSHAGLYREFELERKFYEKAFHCFIINKVLFKSNSISIQLSNCLLQRYRLSFNDNINFLISSDRIYNLGKFMKFA